MTAKDKTQEKIQNGAQGLRLERSRASAQFRGGVFTNTYASTARVDAVTSQAKTKTLMELMLPNSARQPQRPLPSMDPRAAWAQQAETGLRVTWLGHSTLLLEMDGVRILTDPVWAERASPFAFAGPKRFQPVPVDLQALPPLDTVLLSHDHYDHLDRASVLALAARGLKFVTSLGLGQRLEAFGVPLQNIVELDWWEECHAIPGLSITAAPAHHFSGRGLRDRNTTLWSSFALRSEHHSVYFSGDTGLSGAFADIGQRLGPFDLVLLEVGAFHPAWGQMHLGPHNAMQAWQALGSGRLLPIHWGTFALATHPWQEPAEVLFQHAPHERLLMPKLGQAIEPARVEGVQAWWRQGL